MAREERPLVALLTDFGSEDPYVGVMKGVILAHGREATIVDVSHGVAPQDVAAGAFALDAAFRYFPRGTIFVCVVDPGVGSARRILAVRAHDQIFLAPDNGLLTPVLRAATEVRELTRREWFRAHVSNTFHGRDVFAPVAGRLAAGASFEAVGPLLRNDAPAMLLCDEPTFESRDVLLGRIEHVDRYGNLISDVSAARLAAIGRPIVGIELRGVVLPPPVSSYAAVDEGAALAIVDSFDRLEVAVRGASAAQRFAAKVGEPLRVLFAT
jgi:S-adenosylmethionine hydrolase